MVLHPHNTFSISLQMEDAFYANSCVDIRTKTLISRELLNPGFNPGLMALKWDVLSGFTSPYPKHLLPCAASTVKGFCERPASPSSARTFIYKSPKGLRLASFWEITVYRSIDTAATLLDCRLIFFNYPFEE